MTGACCCSPLGPGPGPSPSGGSSLASMPLGGGPALSGGLKIGNLAAGVGGLVSGASSGLKAFSSGGGDVGRCGLGRVEFGAWIIGGSFMSIQATGFVINVTVPGGGSVPANSGTALSITVPGVLATDSVWANQTSAVFPSGMSIVNAFSTGANSVTLQILNCTTSSQSIPSNFPCKIGILRGPNP